MVSGYRIEKYMMQNIFIIVERFMGSGEEL